MLRFISERLIQSAVVLAVMSFVIFGLIGLMPGDPVDLMISADPDLTSADVAKLREIYGLDRPVAERYGSWLLSVLQGDFGFSWPWPFASACRSASGLPSGPIPCAIIRSICSPSPASRSRRSGSACC